MFRAIFKNRCKLQWTQKRKKHIVRSLGIVGAPISKGQPNPGVARAPATLRNHGLVTELEKLGISVDDVGDLLVEDIEGDDRIDNVKFPLTVGAACKKLSNAVSDVLKKNEVCLTLGGDHSIAIGTIHGHSRVQSDVCVLWVDAHSDINTEITTPSGNIHGMSCSFLVKELRKSKSQFPGFEWLSPCIDKSNIAYIGLRDVDPGEKLIMDREKILHFSMGDIDRLGVIEVTNRAIEAINPSGRHSLHVSFDIDSVDPDIAPSTGTPVLGGLTLREALVIAEELSKLSTLKAVDLVEVNPYIGNQEEVDKTLEVAVLILKTLFGQSREGNIIEKFNHDLFEH